MAEPIPRYYCHRCHARFDNPNENFTCPHCGAGFIEETSQQLPPESQPTPASAESLDDDTFDNSRPSYYVIRWRREPQEPVQGTSEETPIPPQLENIITDFFRGFGMIRTGEDGTTVQVIFGNAADYANTREEFDAIVTQLLDQMEGSGTPPLPKELLDAIPTVKITDEHLISKPICSVCWEEFVLDENVRQLACSHLFHDQCIKPWLDLHSTCPLCRHYLGNDPEYMNQENNNRNNMTTLQQLFQAVQRSTSGSVASGENNARESDAEPPQSPGPSSRQT
ncbi:E3 ubiquitin-protein ligase RNF126-like [Agrilus planipennis]|uniref:RING-type E3 ubiquitin transferase n=1 Tax=Agrilus planipennis TaxID=224129 RepID=A0A1W4XGW2_AGRPL|nr:E3 ubiquitin-protein ligase RNF126-like [Agrilus planipennis]